MQKNIVIINVSYYYGGWYLSFSKTFYLPFIPFCNMQIEEGDNIIDLTNNDYCKTIISFNYKTGEFDIDIRNNWYHPVTDDTIDFIVEQFDSTEWERTDSTDVKALKELMLNDYNRKKNFKFSD